MVVHCEGVKGAIADFVCFHCPLVASAEAKPSAPKSHNNQEQQPSAQSRATLHTAPPFSYTSTTPVATRSTNTRSCSTSSIVG